MPLLCHTPGTAQTSKLPQDGASCCLARHTQDSRASTMTAHCPCAFAGTGRCGVRASRLEDWIVRSSPPAQRPALGAHSTVAVPDGCLSTPPTNPPCPPASQQRCWMIEGCLPRPVQRCLMACCAGVTNRPCPPGDGPSLPQAHLAAPLHLTTRPASKHPLTTPPGPWGPCTAAPRNQKPPAHPLIPPAHLSAGCGPGWHGGCAALLA